MYILKFFVRRGDVSLCNQVHGVYNIVTVSHPKYIIIYACYQSTPPYPPHPKKKYKGGGHIKLVCI